MEEAKIKEIKKLLKHAEDKMNYWYDNTENDGCVFNQSDLWTREHETLCKVIEILERKTT